MSKSLKIELIILVIVIVPFVSIFLFPGKIPLIQTLFLLSVVAILYSITAFSLFRVLMGWGFSAVMVGRWRRVPKPPPKWIPPNQARPQERIVALINTIYLFALGSIFLFVYLIFKG